MELPCPYGVQYETRGKANQEVTIELYCMSSTGPREEWIGEETRGKERKGSKEEVARLLSTVTISSLGPQVRKYLESP